MKAGRWLVAALIVLSTACAKADRQAVMAPNFGARVTTAGAATTEAEPEKPMELREEPPSDTAADENAKRAPAKTPDAPPPPPNTTPGAQLAPTGQDPSRKQPILIYKAEFSLSVYEVGKSLDAVEGLAKGFGGYLSRRDDRSITVRVPAEKFQDLIAGIEKIGDVLHRNVVSEDVTAEYRDLEVQLQNLTALRARFEKLLEKAQKVEEALSVERELGRITGEIERIKGRLKLLTDLARYSTITVTFEPHSSDQIQQGPFVLPLPWLNQVNLKRLLTL